MQQIDPLLSKRKLIQTQLFRLAPPGAKALAELVCILCGLAASIAMSAGLFFSRYKTARTEAEYWTNYFAAHPGVEFENAETLLTLPSFRVLLAHCMLGFFCLALAMGLLTIAHWSLYFRESKSIYLMRRIPNRKTFLFHTIGMPLLGAVLTLAAAVLMFLIFRAVYFATPEALIP